MSFNGLVLTKNGKKELIKAADGDSLKFTHIAFGDGTTSEVYTLKESLTNEVKRLPITSVERKEDRIVLTLDYTNKIFEKGFYFREMGIIGNGKLCYYDNSGNDAEYIDPNNQTVTKEKRLRMELAIADDVTVETQVASGMYAMQETVDQLRKENVQQSTKIMDIKMLGWSVPEECPVQNEVSGNQFIQKVGRVDLGRIEWAYDGSDYTRFISDNLKDAKTPSSNDVIANIFLQGYQVVSLNKLLTVTTNNLVAYSAGKMISIRNTSYTDPTDFKKAMQGQYLYYELATPITVTMDGNEKAERIDSSLEALGKCKISKYEYEGIAQVAGNGQFNYCNIATLTVKGEYIDTPIIFRLSGRGKILSNVTVNFASANSKDPSLDTFSTDGNKDFWIKKVDASKWEIYGEYSKSWGGLALWSITTDNTGVDVQVNMTNIASLPSDVIQVSYNKPLSDIEKNLEDLLDPYNRNILANNTDLDTLITPMETYLPYQNTYPNIPSGVSNGMLKVIARSSTVKQILRRHGTVGTNDHEIYIRSYNPSTKVWSDWVRILTTKDAYTHPSYTERTGVPTANQSPAHGGSFHVSQPVSDSTGHITAVNDRTITLPNIYVGGGNGVSASYALNTAQAYFIVGLGSANVAGSGLLCGEYIYYANDKWKRTTILNSTFPTLSISGNTLSVTYNKGSGSYSTDSFLLLRVK